MSSVSTLRPEFGYTLPMLMLVLSVWMAAAVAMALLWFVQQRTQDASAVDLGWAAGIGLAGIAYAVFADGDLQRRMLLAVLAGVWAFRLALYLFINRVWGKPEDRRYAELRRKWGSNSARHFFIFFQAQAALVVMFSLSFLPIAFDSRPLAGPLTISGVVLWLMAIVGESLADTQLARFRSDPQSRGKTCRIGLWKYSRHPNYFFEWLHWWTYAFLAFGTSYFGLTLLAPALMLFLLFKITGIPATEAQALRSRGQDYAAYQRATSAFVPWFPRRDV